MPHPDAEGSFAEWGRPVASGKQATFDLSDTKLQDAWKFFEIASRLDSHRIELLSEVLCIDDVSLVIPSLSINDALDLWSRLCSPKLDGLAVFETFTAATSELSQCDVSVLRKLLDPTSHPTPGALTRQKTERSVAAAEGRKRAREFTDAADDAVALRKADAPAATKTPAARGGAAAAAGTTTTAVGGATAPVAGTALHVPRYATLPVDYRTHGKDAIPKGPIDPEHPQRITDCSIDKVIRRIARPGGGRSKLTLVVDTKFDGERLIVHKVGPAFQFFSRNMLPVPERKLAHVREALTKSLGDTSVLLDCEILSKHTFGSMNKVKKHELGDAAPETPIRIYVFDILWINGHNIQSLPLSDRRLLQRHAIRVQPNAVEHADTVTIEASDHADAANQLQSCFNTVMSDRLEGLVVKPTDSPYTNGGTHWVKVKKDYIPATGVGAITTTADRTFAGTTATRFVMKNVPKGPGAGAPSADLATSTGDMKLNDTVDLLIVGRLADNRLLAATLDKGTDASHKNIIVAVVKDPSGLCGKYLRDLSVGSASDPKAKATFVNWPEALLSSSPSSTLKLAGFADFRDKCPVVEVSAAKIIERVSCADSAAIDEGLNWTLSADAAITRLRDDKSPQDVTPLSAMKALVSEATLRQTKSFEASCVFASENSLDVDFDGAEDDEWEDGKKVDRMVKRDSMTVMMKWVSATLTSKKPPVGAAIFVLVPVARERFWSERGLMGEVTTTLGPATKMHCDSVIARKTCRPGSIVVTEATWGEAAPFHCAVVPMAILDFPGGAKKPSMSESQATTALRRLRHLCTSIVRGATSTPCNGCKSIVIVVKEDSICSSAFVTLLRRIVLGPVSREIGSVAVGGEPFQLQLQVHTT